MSRLDVANVALYLRDVTKIWVSRDRRFTLHVRAFDVGRGEVVAVHGPSGSGKSTLLEVIGLATSPDHSRLFVVGGTEGLIDVAALHAAGDSRALARLRASRLGFVLQTGALLPFLTVGENVVLPQKLAGYTDDGRCRWLLEQLGLVGYAGSYPSDLSFGQRQRAAIARALAHAPEIVLADEPTAALDPPSKTRVVDLFVQLAYELGTAVVIATHERDLLRNRPIRRVEIIVRSEANASQVHADLEAAS